MKKYLKNKQFVIEDDQEFGELKAGVVNAIDQRTSSRVKIKGFYLTREITADNAEKEAKELKSLDHRNIVKFIDFIGAEKPSWCYTRMSFIVMESLDGGSVKDMIAKRLTAGNFLSLPEIKNLSVQLVSAVAYCHEKSVLHLDIKPANVFISSDEKTIKLGDFGSAREVSTITITSATSGTILSTEMYSTPECLMNERKKSPSIDVWGLALVIQEIITLHHAFYPEENKIKANIPFEIRQNIVAGRRRDIKDFRPDAQEFIPYQKFLEKCLSARKEMRPKNAIVLKEEKILQHMLIDDTVDREYGNEKTEDEIDKLRRHIEMLEGNLEKQTNENLLLKKKIIDQEGILDEDNPKWVGTFGRKSNLVADFVRKLTPLDGLGHYSGPDKSQKAGGPRPIMGETHLQEVCKMLFCGHLQINLKFWMFDKIEGEFCGYSISFQREKNDSLGVFEFILKIGSPGQDSFTAIAEEIDPPLGKIRNTVDLTSVLEDDKQTMKFVGKNNMVYIRYNLTRIIKKEKF